MDPTFETLSATPTGSITVNYLAPTLTLSGTGTLAEYQTVLQSVTYNNTDQDPNTTSRTLAFQANDGGGVNNLSTIVNKTVSITAVNDAPVLVGPAGSISYTENGAPLVIAPALTVTDADSANITGATVTISANDAAEDLLSFTAGFGITGSQTGNVLTLSGNTTVANWQTVLRTVSYANSSDNPSTLSRTVDFQVDDGAGVNNLSNTATRTVDVSAANDAPVLDASKSPTLTAENEDAPAPVGPVGTPVSSLVDFVVPAGGLDNVTDVDASPVSGVAITGADSNGTWSYSINNGATWNALGAVTNVSARLLAADANSRVYFTPNANLNGTIAAAITFRAWDQTSGTNGGLASTATNGGTTAFSSATDTAALTITAVNDAPSFTKGADQSNVTNQNPDNSPKAYTIDPWATAISPGPAEEVVQAVDFVIDSNTNTGLFTVAPAVSPTGVLTFTTDPTTSGTATITLHIHDNGGTTPGVDASTTQSFTITTVFPPPIAVDDAYTATGNVSIDVNTVAEGVLQRGTDDTLFGGALDKFGATASPATAVNGTNTVTTTNGGTVKLNTNGTFTYDPPPGFLGADSFFYNLHNAGGDDVGQVTITMSNMIWFFDDSNASAGDGRLSNPFKAISSFVNDNATNHGKDGQTLFIASGSYSSGLTLRPNQILIGKGASSSISTISGITPPTFSATLPGTGGVNPTITNGSGIGLNLASGVVVHGVTVSGSSGVGVNGTSITTATIASTVLISGNAGTELSLQTAAGGNIDVAATITNGSAGQTINVQNRSSGTVSFTGNVTAAGASGGTNVNIDSNAGATVTFSGGLSLTTGTQAAFAATTSGTVNVVDSGAITNSIATTTGDAVTITGVIIGASGVTFDTVSTSGAANGIQLANTGAGAFTANGGSIVNATNRGIDINGGTGNVTYTGPIASSATGRSVEVTNHSGGIAAFSGLITDNGLGVNLQTNTGSTVNFTGGVVVSTGASTGFNASGGGAVTVTGANNTITTSAGTALSVVSTNIGSAGLTFKSISASGAAKGIVLNTTGTGAGDGSLSVTGTGTTDGSGGTIQSISARGAEFTGTKTLSLKNMNFTNANTSDAGGAGTCDDTNTTNCNAAIYLNSVTTATFDNINITGTTVENGINGLDVTDLTLTNSTIDHAGTNAGGSDLPADEGAVIMRGLTGTVTLNNDDFSFAGGPTVEIKNTTGNLILNTNLTTYRDTQSSASGQGGLQIVTTGTTVVHPSAVVNVTNSSFLRLRSHGVNIQSVGTTDTGSASSDVDISGSTFDTGAAPGTMIGIDLDADDASTLVFNIVNNPIVYARNGPAINIFGDVSASINGRINNNPDVQVKSNPGFSQVGSGIRANLNQNATGRIEVKNNVINIGSDDAGIDLSAIGKTTANPGGATNTLDATVTGNTITIGATSTYGVVIIVASNAGDTNAACSNVATNAVTRNPSSIASFRARVASANGFFKMNGFATDAGITWNNNANTPLNDSTFGGSGTFGACTAALPTNPGVTP